MSDGEFEFTVKNPGDKADVQLVFDVPKDSKLDAVVLFGSFGSEGVPVKLGD